MVRGSNPGGGEIFRPSRPALGPTQPPVRVFSGGKVWPGCAADHSPPSSAEVLKEYSYTSAPLWATTGPVTVLLYSLLTNSLIFHIHIESFCKSSRVKTYLYQSDSTMQYMQRMLHLCQQDTALCSRCRPAK